MSGTRLTRAQTTGKGASKGVPAWLLGLVALLLLGVMVSAGLLFSSQGIEETRADVGPDSRIAAAQRVAKEHPGDLALLRQLAYVYQQANRPEDALREYAGVLARDPQDTASLYNSGLIELHLGDAQRGESRLRSVIELIPTHALAAKALGEHYAEAGEFERMVKTVVPAADAHPELADLQYLAGLALEKTGGATQAEQRYRAALRLVPDLSEARDGLRRVGSAQ